MTTKAKKTPKTKTPASSPPLDTAMMYEDAIRYVHDRCARFGAEGATTDTFALGQHGDWKGVRKALVVALRRVVKDAESIPWAPEDGLAGGVRRGFASPMEHVFDVLEQCDDLDAAYLTSSLLVQALKAVVLKAHGRPVPPEYEGDQPTRRVVKK